MGDVTSGGWMRTAQSPESQGKKRLSTIAVVLLLGVLSRGGIVAGEPQSTPRPGDGTVTEQASRVSTIAPDAVGACCRTNGACDELDPFDCSVALYGFYLGNGTDCASVTCPRGACCSQNGCSVTANTECSSIGGNYLGDGTDCASATCPTGGCCSQNGCDVVDPYTCSANGGAYAGDGTDCASAMCGACCTPYATNGCFFTPPDFCAAYGTFAGGGTNCTTGTCPPVGACCYAYGCYGTTYPDICASYGGTYAGDGTDCTSCAHVGACCVFDTCAVWDEGTCMSYGGTYHGDGTDCEDVVCTGACCVRGACSVGGSYSCSNLGGTYHGDGTLCDVGACDGACCRFDGSCEQVPEPSCLALGGSYSGDRTACCALTCASCGSSTCSVSLEPVRDNTLFEDPEGLLSDGADGSLFVGRIPKGSGLRRRALLAFDVAGAIPPGSTIVSAELALRPRSTNSYIVAPIELNRVFADWGEGASDSSGRGKGGPAQTEDATWRHRFFDTVFWSVPGGAFASMASAVVSRPPYTWSSTQLTADVQDWLDDPLHNFGWVLTGGEDAPGTIKAFWSRDSTDDSLRPRLQVVFQSDRGACCLPGGSCAEDLDVLTCESQGGALREGTACASAACARAPLPCEDDNPCTVDSCDSRSGCLHTPGNAGTLCRSSAGVCDANDSCDGVGAACPEQFVAAGTACRASSGVCDVAESCTGTSAACPADGFRSPGTACTSDGDACTLDECEGDGACVHSFQDHDSDGVCDASDSCLSSILTPTVAVGDCETGVGNHEFEDGCTFADLIRRCLLGDERHDKGVSCVAHLTNGWKKQDLIRDAEEGRIRRCAAQNKTAPVKTGPRLEAASSRSRRPRL